MSKRRRNNKDRTKGGSGILASGSGVLPDNGEKGGLFGRCILLFVLSAALAVVVLAVHWPALATEALSYDDQQYMTENMLVRDPCWGSAWRFLSEVFAPSTVEGYYQPLNMISLMLDYAMGGRPDNLRPFHFTSLLLHAANTLLIFWLLYMFFGRVWPAALVSLLFGVHPLTVEPIPWVGERKTLLSAFFGLWCLIFYIAYARKGGKWCYVGCLLAYVLALMSKPTSTPLPVAMLLLDYWPLNRFGRQAVIEKLPFFAIGILSAVITYISQSTTAGAHSPGEYDFFHVPLVLGHNIIFYLYKIVWPANLSSHYPFPDPVSISDGMVLAGVVGTFLLMTVLLISWRWTRALLAGWLIFFVTIFPTMQVIGFSNVIASEKFAYLPSVGILLILAWLLKGIWDSSGGVRVMAVRRAGIVFVVVVVSVFEVRAVRNYYPHWTNTVTLFDRMVSMTPEVALLHNALGSAYMDDGRVDEAIASYRRSIELDSSHSGVYNNLAIALFEKGREDEAVKYYQLGIKLEPSNASSYYNLANVLLKRGRLDDALRNYDIALRLRPGYPVIHFGYGRALVAKGLFDDGIEHYRRAEKLMASNPDIYYYWAKALEGKGAVAEAMAKYDRALELKSDYADAYNNLAVLHAKSDNYERAAALLKKAIEYRPGYVKAYNNLGNVYYKQERMGEAMEYYRSALRIEPDNFAAHYNLANILLRQGSPDKAIEHYREALRVRPGHAGAQKGLDLALTLQQRSGG